MPGRAAIRKKLVSKRGESSSPLSPLAYDVETTGRKFRDGAKIFAFSTCDTRGTTNIARLDIPDFIYTKEKIENLLQAIWNNTNIAKVAHNMKFDLGMTKAYGIQVPKGTVIHDTMIMSQLLRNLAPSHALENLAFELCGYSKDIDLEIKKLGRKYKNDYSKIPIDIMNPYQHADAERCMLLYLLFYPEIQKDKGLSYIYDEEIKLIWTTLAIEDRGIMINPDRTHKLVKWLEAKRDQALKELKDFAGKLVNPDVRKDLFFILFHKLNLPVLKLTEKLHEPCTEKEVMLQYMELYPHPALNAIMAYRSYSKSATKISNYLNFADENNIIHPNINTNQARSGRESISEPALQGVQKSEVLLNPYPVPGRRIFQPKPGFINIHIDYAGIEARRGADESGDKKMIELFKNGIDPHEYAAKIWFDTNDPGKTRRNAAKNGNYCVLYGGGLRKLAEGTLGLTPQELKPRHEKYKKDFPGYCSFANRLQNEVLSKGYVTTKMGRRLYIALDTPYVAANYLIQGSAGDILKIAQNRVHEYTEEVTGGEAGIILPVHDEIAIEYPRARWPEVKPYLRGVRERMIDFPELKVPMEVDIEVSTHSWEKLEEFSID